MLWTIFVFLLGAFTGWLTPMPTWAAKVWARVLGVKAVVLKSFDDNQPHRPL